MNSALQLGIQRLGKTTCYPRALKLQKQLGQTCTHGSGLTYIEHNTYCSSVPRYPVDLFHGTVLVSFTCACTIPVTAIVT